MSLTPLKKSGPWVQTLLFLQACRPEARGVSRVAEDVAQRTFRWPRWLFYYYYFIYLFILGTERACGMSDEQEDGRFGTVKLEVGRFLSALLRTNNASVLRSFLQLGILPLCLVRSPHPFLFAVFLPFCGFVL